MRIWIRTITSEAVKSHSSTRHAFFSSDATSFTSLGYFSCTAPQIEDGKDVAARRLRFSPTLQEHVKSTTHFRRPTHKTNTHESTPVHTQYFTNTHVYTTSRTNASIGYFQDIGGWNRKNARVNTSERKRRADYNVALGFRREVGFRHTSSRGCRIGNVFFFSCRSAQAKR